MGIDNPTGGGGGGVGGFVPSTPASAPTPTPTDGQYNTNQFYRLTEVEPYGIDRNSFDNPPFLWPGKRTRDAVGEHQVQRGYMRSLISDPEVNANMKNRRLFFQFNPQVLVRSVQQSVGSMSPLLQDPAQLMQPVPGTASFGFELMFNREHEVNAGYNDPNTDWLTLPNNDKALVSDIGVLADLMVLDTITGQGLSSELINSVINQEKLRYANQNTVINNTKEELTKAGLDEEAKKQIPIEVPSDTVMSDVFTSNIGNTAFLNPLPFRVMFSSLFMVEGVATSVDVVFQKFSRTMVPTQCKVTINMYALYLGFAKKKTFIYDNLIQAKQIGEETAEIDSAVESALKNSILSVSGRCSRNSFNVSPPYTAFPSERAPCFEVSDITRSKQFQEYLKKNEVTEANFSFALEYLFSPGGTTLYSDVDIAKNRVDLLQDGKKPNFNAKETVNVKGLRALENGVSIFQNQVVNRNGLGDGEVLNGYISFRIIMIVHAIAKSGNTVKVEMPLTVVRNYHWTDRFEEYSLEGKYTYVPTNVNGIPVTRVDASIRPPRNTRFNP